MGQTYRTWDERRQIVRSIIAESSASTLESFGLSTSEETYYRARAERLLDRLAQKSSTFKAYYHLRTDQPFLYVLWVVLLVVVFASASATFLWLRSQGATQYYPLLAALGGIAAAAVGWGVAGWIAHNNAVRQNTNNLLFARFTQAPFNDAMHRFHFAFGSGLEPVTPELIQAEAAKGEEGRKAAASVNYLLNYYEFIAAGVLRGDFNPRIVRENIRGVICFYYDKCEPHICAANRRNHRIFEHLRKLRTHYREP